MADATTKKSTAKKSAAKKSAAKKSAAKKSTAKSAGAPDTGAKKARARAEPARRSSNSTPRTPQSGSRVAAAAWEAVLEFTGKRAEAVTGLERGDDGWTVELEVLELERIPSTTDVLATYQVRLDQDGELQGCRRVRRYLRGSPGDE